MAGRGKNKGQGGVRIQVAAEVMGVERGEEVARLAVYAFGKSGRLLDRADLERDKASVLTLPDAGEPDEIRVLVGPALDVEGPQLLSDLIRIGAVEKMVSPADLTVERIVLPLDRTQWYCWLRFCTARGTLVKQVTSGGIPLELPVCDAEVEVYEVDPLLILITKIPDHIIERLRDVIRHPIPDPDPAPFLVPEIGLGAVAAFAAAELQDGEQIDDDRGSDNVAHGSRLFRFAGDEQQIVTREEAADALRAISIDPAIVRAAKIGTTAFKDALAALPELTRPLLCFLWPTAVTTQLVATTTTDRCGHFRAVFYRGCSNDVPDLYFKAYRHIGFWRIPIYTPTPIACYTWWNYTCGTKIRLVTTSPFAQTCPPCPPVIAPDHWVLAMAVGNTSLASIRGTSSALAASTNPGNRGLTAGGQPWGGYLHFRFEFDHLLRTELNVRYYQVSWSKVGSGNPYVPLTDTQLRHYLHKVGTKFPIDPYVLGPQTVQGTPNLFEMPPALPPVGQWVIADAVVDTSSAGYASASMAPPAGAGFYDFKLDLYDGNGVRVNANTLGISYRVPATTDLAGTIATDDAASLGLVTANGSLVVRLHIDNNTCDGSIGAAELGGQAADSECGVLEYASTAANITLPFTASHPNGFATYDFRVVKGLTAVLTDSGPVGLPPGGHTLTPSVASLLGACATAGFAEDLQVVAMATDGWSRLSGYDKRPLPRPFVLTSPV